MYVHSHTISKHMQWPKTCEIFEVEIYNRRLLLLLLLMTYYQNRCAGMCRLFKYIIIQCNVVISTLNCPKRGFMLEPINILDMLNDDICCRVACIESVSSILTHLSNYRSCAIAYCHLPFAFCLLPFAFHCSKFAFRGLHLFFIWQIDLQLQSYAS